MDTNVNQLRRNVVIITSQAARIRGLEANVRTLESRHKSNTNNNRALRQMYETSVDREVKKSMWLGVFFLLLCHFMRKADSILDGVFT